MRLLTRSRLHYLTALLVLTIYGGQVCPFVDSLSFVEQVTPLVILLFVQYALRRPVHAKAGTDNDDVHRARRVIQVEMGLFVASALVLTAFNTVVHEFPLVSGLKLLIGFATLGFFAAVDLGLAAELNMAKRLKAQGRQLTLTAKPFPISRKVGLFASIAAVMVVMVFFLLINKDLEWMGGIGTTVTLAQAQRAVLGEFSFVTVVLLGHLLNVIRSYARNLKWFLSNQNQVMARTTEGHFDARVPVSTNDEFGAMAIYTNDMVEGLKTRTEELVRTQDVTIQALASLAETRDNETGAHIQRTQRYVRALAEHLAGHPKFSEELTRDNIELLFKSAPLHDIGKVGIPDSILLKPGKHTDDEFAIMKTHAQLGADALARAEAALGTCSFLTYAKEIAATHHEKWDGSGYPNGLKGEAIPLSGRLMAVADVYDALISKRVYKPAFPHDKAVAIIVEGRGKHFDPDVVDAMLAIEAVFVSIKETYADEDAEPEPAAAE